MEHDISDETFAVLKRNTQGFFKKDKNQQDRSGYEVRADFLRAFPVIGSG